MRPGGRRRTGSGSPVRLPGEIFGRRPQDVAFGVQLHRFGFKLADPLPQPGGLLLMGLGRTGRRHGVAMLAERDARGSLSQADSEPCAIPRSAAIWATVAPSVTRYSST